MRVVPGACRSAPSCPGFGARGRAFSSSEKKPPAGLKEGSWKKSNSARALSMSHSRCAVSVAKRGVPATARSRCSPIIWPRPVNRRRGAYRQGGALTRRVAKLHDVTVVWPKIGSGRAGRRRLEGPAAPPLKGRSGRLGFLGGWPFGCENLTFFGVGKAWISLDSLVRNEPFQWVTRDFRRKKIRAPLWPEGRHRRDGR